MSTLAAIAASRRTKAHPAGAILRPVFSFPVLLGGLLVAGGCFIARFNLLDPDTWWHLAVGQRILTTGSWPTSDVYSLTASGTPWIAYEWLGEVAMALVGGRGGLRASAVMLTVLACLFLLLLYHLAYLRSGNIKTAFLACTLALPFASVFFTLRPQLFGYIFLLLTLICLEHFRRGRPEALWPLPSLFLIWVNTHGSFVLGLAVLGLCWLSGQVEFQKGGLVAKHWTPEQSRQLVVAMLVCVLVLPLTPYGTRLVSYPLEIGTSQPVNLANIQEWLPLSFNSLVGKTALGFFLASLLAQLVFRLNYRLEEMALFLIATYGACVHVRLQFFFIAISTPLLAELLGVMLARQIPPYQPRKDRYFLNAVLLTLIAAGIVLFFPSERSLLDQTGASYPFGAVRYLQDHPVQGPILNEYGWGGYLIWSGIPAQGVFIDGRADIYEHSGVLSDYLGIMRLEPNTLLLLRKYRVHACLIQARAPLATLLATLPDWERPYSDNVSVLYVHKQRHPASSEALPEFEGRKESAELHPGSENESRQPKMALVHTW